MTIVSVPTHLPCGSRFEVQNGVPSLLIMMSRLLILLVLLYRATLGPVLGGHCRYHPSCSQYMIDAVRKYGAWRGLWRGVRRIARCHPFGRFGPDPA